MTDVASDAAVADGGSGDGDVDGLVDELTMGEKRVLIKGALDPAGIATGYVPAIDRLDIPGFSMVDGPMGIRAVTATAFPATVSLAASFDEELAAEFGEAIGTEARGADQDALLAPGVNIARVPQCGRNFEYYSEDPLLSAALSTSMIEGVQDAGTMATVKHYLANNQESDRHHVSAEVGERALRELYLPAFRATVQEAEVASVMASYNRVNGTHATEHRRILTEILREEWGFDGFVVSDWWSVTDGPAAVEAGLDLEMPGMPVYEWHEGEGRLLSLLETLSGIGWVPTETIARILTKPWQPENPNPHVLEQAHFGDELTEAIEAGRIEEADLDLMVERILGQYERFGMLDGDQPDGEVAAPAHQELSRRIAQRGTVLLENDGALPLDTEAIDEVALVGPNADEPKVGGGGSSEVDAVETIAPAAGLREALGEDVSVTVERGVERIAEGSFGESPLPDLPSLPGSGPDIADAEAVAGDADVAVVMLQDAAHEGADHDFELPGRQNELVERVAAAAEETVVVLKTSSAVAMPWAEDVDAIVEAWYPGQSDGLAVGTVLAGDADPSGRLPVSVGTAAEDYPPSTEAEYPGVDLEVEYTEGVFVGYRHFDHADVEPRYPFGHGESYADFEYGDVSVAATDDGGAEVSVTVENVADRAGREVVQCYVETPGEAIERPPRELVAFEALALDPGEERTVELSVDREELAYYDVDAEDWAVEDGEHRFHVGRSSRDLRGSGSVDVDA